MKSIATALAAFVALTAVATAANADTITLHGVWDKIWAEKKHGK